MRYPKEHRYRGIVADEYRLIKLAYPHVDEFQHSVGKCLADHVPQSTVRPLRVLEVGCGDGLTTIELLSARDDSHIVAIDIEPSMLARARANLPDWKEPRLSLVEADALSFARSASDDSYDVIASAWTLHNFRSAYRFLFLKEAFRILKCGGLFINGDKYAQEGNKHHACLALQMRRFFDAYLPIGRYEFLQDFVLHNIDDESPSRILRELEYIKDMRAIGYSSINRVYRENMEAVYIASKANDAV